MFVALGLAGSAAAAEPGDHVSIVDPRLRPSEPVVPEPAAAPEPAPERTATDVSGAPVPGHESGRADPGDDGDSALRIIGRGVLFVPKLALDAVLFPVRGSVWAFERYHLTDRYRRTFYNDSQTIGLFPTLAIDSSLGITAGAGFIDRDLFGEREQLTLHASGGSRYHQIYAAGLRSGKRLGERFSIDLDVGYERRPHDTFYGIGNGDPADEPAMPIDPRVDPTSVAAHYRQDRARVSVTADLRVWSRLHVRAAGAASEVNFGRGDEGDTIDVLYDPDGLVGWGGVRYGYSELELRWDSRRESTIMEPAAVYSAGTLADVFGGRMHRLDTGPDFWRYGADFQEFVRLAAGPRVISLHLHGEGVTGNRDEVPFTELPRLGGPSYLRGYDLDRFRDRVAAFGSVAYEWDLSQWFSANLFADIGRVYPSVGEMSLDHLRMGYGIGIEAHSVDSFTFEGSLGSSIDGGLFLNLSFNPVYDLDQRVRRR